MREGAVRPPQSPWRGELAVCAPDGGVQAVPRAELLVLIAQGLDLAAERLVLAAQLVLSVGEPLRPDREVSYPLAALGEQPERDQQRARIFGCRIGVRRHRVAV